ncbi:sulfur carrier protein ThiS [Marinomonas transparens]|uniref:Sulfur carrier protein ThiS n=1 Tax=Marinomonas transparens TaxID=2795388 RepID=A0A934JUT8_9GAMM|nr:sulfur carrier protein ThiS [Marinomonas transparens]MBJ7537740.1 sulfur carrier protein ThiS [Marinomonas transparens]
MNIILNDEAFHFAGGTLLDLLAVLGKPIEGVAIAINQSIVPKSIWAETLLETDAQVFIFESIAGG